MGSSVFLGKVGGGGGGGFTPGKINNYALTPGDIAAGFIDLPVLAQVVEFYTGQIPQTESVDYTLSNVGVTRITFAGELMAGGGNALEAGDRINVSFWF